jgi:hypothetical protein
MGCGEVYVCVVQVLVGMGVLKGSVGGGWAGVCVENSPYRDGNKRENAYPESRLGSVVLGC